MISKLAGSMSFAFTLLCATHAVAAPSEAIKQDAVKVNESCTADAKTAGCGDQKVGDGLLKCLHEYKKQHAEFKFSEACKGSFQKMRADRRAGR